MPPVLPPGYAPGTQDLTIIVDSDSYYYLYDIRILQM